MLAVKSLNSSISVLWIGIWPIMHETSTEVEIFHLYEANVNVQQTLTCRQYCPLMFFFTVVILLLTRHWIWSETASLFIHYVDHYNYSITKFFYRTTLEASWSCKFLLALPAHQGLTKNLKLHYDWWAVWQPVLRSYSASACTE